MQPSETNKSNKQIRDESLFAVLAMGLSQLRELEKKIPTTSLARDIKAYEYLISQANRTLTLRYFKKREQMWEAGKLAKVAEVLDAMKLEWEN